MALALVVMLIWLLSDEWIRTIEFHLPPSSRSPRSDPDAGRKTKNPSRVREVCARVWGTVAVPYGVVRNGHCGPARLLPIIMTNEDTASVWHSIRSVTAVSQNAVVTLLASSRGAR
ncbi:hypothetical protein GCM10010253_33890 [Streptomyces badius]|uniref:Secreted protein n=1 Tax=Streptomyces badius TaxID=1941 RepID=A0ABQ2TA81_STRBA|nr:hypothetical protein GCM10010253_33890 [Streptomyces badius]